MALIHASGGAVFVGSDEFGDIVVTPVGELDLAVAPIVLGASREAIPGKPRRIVLDLGSVTFLDSGGATCSQWHGAKRAPLASASRYARRWPAWFAAYSRSPCC